MNKVNSSHWWDQQEGSTIRKISLAVIFMSCLAVMVVSIRSFYFWQIYTFALCLGYLSASIIVIITLLVLHKLKLILRDNAIYLFTFGLLFVTCLLVVFLQIGFYLRTPMLVVFTLANFSICFAVYRWIWDSKRLSLFLCVTTITFLHAGFSIFGTIYTIQKDTEHLFRLLADPERHTMFIAPNNLYGYACPGEYFDSQQCRQLFFKGGYKQWENQKEKQGQLRGFSEGLEMLKQLKENDGNSKSD